MNTPTATASHRAGASSLSALRETPARLSPLTAAATLDVPVPVPAPAPAPAPAPSVCAADRTPFPAEDTTRGVDDQQQSLAPAEARPTVVDGAGVGTLHCGEAGVSFPLVLLPGAATAADRSVDLNSSLLECFLCQCWLLLFSVFMLSTCRPASPRSQARSSSSFK
jgi:hypothetical protein